MITLLYILLAASTAVAVAAWAVLAWRLLAVLARRRP